MDFQLIGPLSLRKKRDSCPLEAEIVHLLRYLRYYRHEIKPVDPIKFLSTFVFGGVYLADNLQTLERLYLLKIPATHERRISRIHRQFFEAILPFTGRDFNRNHEFSKTRGILVERLALVILKCEEGKTGDHSMILFEDGESFGKKSSAEHEELDLVVYPENNEMAVGECKFDGSRYYGEDKLIKWYETAAERIELEGLRIAHVFAVCGSNPDLMTKHLRRMNLTRTWWLFSVSDYQRQWKVKP